MAAGGSSEANVRIQAKIVGAEAAQRDLERINKKLGDPRATAALEALRKQLEKVRGELESGRQNTSDFTKELTKLTGQAKALKELRNALVDIGLESRKLSPNDAASPMGRAQQRASVRQGIIQGGLQGLGGGRLGSMMQRGRGGFAQVAAMVVAHGLRAGMQTLMQPRNMAQIMGSVPLVGTVLGPAATQMIEGGRQGLTTRAQFQRLADLQGAISTDVFEADPMSRTQYEQLDRQRGDMQLMGRALGRAGRYTEGRDLYRQRLRVEAAMNELRNRDSRTALLSRIMQTGGARGLTEQQTMDAVRGALSAGGSSLQNQTLMSNALSLQRFGLSGEQVGGVSRAMRANYGRATDDEGNEIDATGPLFNQLIGQLRNSDVAQAEQVEVLKTIADEVVKQNEQGIAFNATGAARLAQSLSQFGGGGDIARILREMSASAQDIGMNGVRTPFQMAQLLAETGGRLDEDSVAQARARMEEGTMSYGSFYRAVQSARRIAGEGISSPAAVENRIMRQLRQSGIKISRSRLRNMPSPGDIGGIADTPVDFVAESMMGERVDPTLQRIEASRARATTARLDLSEQAGDLEQAHANVVRSLSQYSNILGALTSTVRDMTGGASAQ